MNIVISGGTGFLGSFLVEELLKKKYSVTILSRSPRVSQNSLVRYVQWNPKGNVDEQSEFLDVIAECDVVINLAGKGVFDQRWNKNVQDEILESRLCSLHALHFAFKKISEKISAGQKVRTMPTLISASGSGYYGDTDNAIVNESAPSGKDFLASVCVAWENAARQCESLGCRVVITRIGIVLHPQGGALQKMLFPFRLFIGGPLGSGRQYFPWIHIRDVVRGIIYTLENENISGVCNLVAPNTVTMQEFCHELGNVLHRPSLFKVPGFMLSLAVGKAAYALLTGQRPTPKVLKQHGFQFEFTTIQSALEDLLRTKA